MVNESRLVLWTIRLLGAGSFAALMIFEWQRWPNGSPLLGPLGFIWYGGLDPCTVMLCVFLTPAVLAFALRPSIVSAAVSLLGFFAWTFLGELAKGIGC